MFILHFLYFEEIILNPVPHIKFQMLRSFFFHLWITIFLSNLSLYRYGLSLVNLNCLINWYSKLKDPSKWPQKVIFHTEKIYSMKTHHDKFNTFQFFSWHVEKNYWVSPLSHFFSNSLHYNLFNVPQMIRWWQHRVPEAY